MKKTRLGSPELPALFRSADEASRRAQRIYLGLIGADLALLICGAMLASTSPAYASSSTQSIMGAGLLFLGLLVTGGLWLSNSDTVWYGARAVAESVKTLSWRYVMGAEPYPLTATQEDIEKRFLADLREILSQRRYLSWTFGGEISGLPQITGRMREIRALSLKDRVGVYTSDRIAEQQAWYGTKSKGHATRKAVWFAAFFGAQLGAFACAVYSISTPTAPNLTGFLATLSSAFLAWIQANKFHELAQAYGLTAHELGFVKEKAAHVKSNQELAEFVSDAENAISREHTLWAARRDR